MSDCICADATGSIVSGSLTGPQSRKKATFGGSIMTAQPTPKGAWKITFLLFLFMLVNFADKIVVGLAGVPIMTELKLEPEQFGLLGSSFFFLFSISAIVVGFIVNRVDTRWVLLALAARLGADAISHGRRGQFHHALDLPRDSRRRRGACLFGRGACDLQMVSRREANPADGDSIPGVGFRRDPRSARVELDHRQSLPGIMPSARSAWSA